MEARFHRLVTPSAVHVQEMFVIGSEISTFILLHVFSLAVKYRPYFHKLVIT